MPRPITVDGGRYKFALDLRLGTLRRIQGALGIDILNPFDGDPPLIARLGTDAGLIIDCVWVAVERDAKAAGLADAQAFLDAMSASEAAAVVTAWQEELENFFQQLGRRELVAAMRKQAVLMAAGMRIAVERVEAMELPEMPGTTSTAPPASSASTPPA